MKKLILLFLFVIINLSVMAKKPTMPEYSITAVGIGMEGYYLVKVTAVVEKKKDATIALAEKCALHGVVFKGFTGECYSENAMIASNMLSSEDAVKVNELIEIEYNRFATTDASIPQMIKVGNRYKVTAVIQVSKDMLRHRLEDMGIIKKIGL